MSEKPVASIKTLARYEPDTVYIGTGEYVAECVRADDGDYYLAADVDAEIEALRAEVNGAIRELLAERNALREALEMMVEMVEMNGFGRDYAMDVARAALSKENKA